jgi:hypothetical protein
MARRKERLNEVKAEKEEIPVPPRDEGTLEDLFSGAKPIYSNESSLDSMNASNKKFYEIFAQKAVNKAFKEENELLEELINATYHTDIPELTYSDRDLMRTLMNVV